MTDDKPEAVQFTINAPPDRLGGVYANFAMVNHSQYEFTLDFIRRDYTQGGATGQLQVRVNMSPLFVRQLIDALEKNWEVYAAKAMPPEARGENQPD
ncbi:MAG TPA: DUF3467 domain-containing protein [Acidimicrobiia bacterium]|jgi:hypothetical protein